MTLRLKVVAPLVLAMAGRILWHWRYYHTRKLTAHSINFLYSLQLSLPANIIYSYSRPEHVFDSDIVSLSASRYNSQSARLA